MLKISFSISETRKISNWICLVRIRFHSFRNQIGFQSQINAAIIRQTKTLKTFFQENFVTSDCWADALTELARLIDQQQYSGW